MVIDIALPDGTALVVRHMDQIAVGVSPLHAHDFIVKDPEVTLEEPCRALFVYFYFWFYLWNFHQFEVYWKEWMDAIWEDVPQSNSSVEGGPFSLCDLPRAVGHLTSK